MLEGVLAPKENRNIAVITLVHIWFTDMRIKVRSFIIIIMIFIVLCKDGLRKISHAVTVTV